LNTALYFRDFENWTSDRSLAKDFKSTVNAQAFCLGLKLYDCEIVMSFGEQFYDVRLPSAQTHSYRHPGP